MLEQPSDRAKRLHVDEKKSSALLEKKNEVFVGKVVLADGAYRLALSKDPDTLLRLTRARRESEFESDQINLRKYYEKVITVNGTRQDEWIRAAGRADWTEHERAQGDTAVALAGKVQQLR